MDYVYPTSKEENYVKGSFTAVNGAVVTFESPAVFNPDGTCDQSASLEKVDKLIANINKRLTMPRTKG